MDATQDLMTQSIALEGFEVIGGQIFDPNGQEFIVKGANMFAWDYPNIDNYLDTWGFNTLRVPNYLLGTEGQPHPGIDGYAINQMIVDAAVERNSVVIFSAHDRIGSYYEGEDLEILKDYWRDMARLHRDNPNVWFNLSNEPGNNPADGPKWVDYHRELIEIIRAEGANNLLIIDAENWGQDYYDRTVVEHAQDVLADNDNIVFSLHIYEQWGDGQELGDYLDAFQAADIPLVIGEYGDVEAAAPLIEAVQAREMGRAVWVAQALDRHDLTTGEGGDARHFNGMNTEILTELGHLVWEDLQRPETLTQITDVIDVRQGQHQIEVTAGAGLILVQGFGGMGTEATPSDDVLAELDTLRLSGAGLTVENLILTQRGNDLWITFAEEAETAIVLQDFTAENFGNRIDAEGLGVGNIIFDGQTEVGTAFSVWGLETVDAELTTVNSVTFLNDVRNRIRGFHDSDDVINGLDGHDVLRGRTGEDVLRGGQGNDRLFGNQGDDVLLGGVGDDSLVGGHDNDTLIGGAGYDTFRIRNDRRGVDAIADFESGRDVLKLWEGLTFADLTIVQGTGEQSADTLIYDAAEQLIAILKATDATTLSAADFVTRNHTHAIAKGDALKTVIHFGRIGSSESPSAGHLAELDTLKFTGEGLTARNLSLTQVGRDLHVSFIGASDTRVILRDVDVQQVDNLDLTADPEVGAVFGNFIFDGETEVTDGIDIVKAGTKTVTIDQADRVTFVNNRNNQVMGLDDSADIINAQGGNDTVRGGSGWDILRGGNGDDDLYGDDGNDLLEGELGHDYLVGGAGDDTLSGGSGQDQFVITTNQGVDRIADFVTGTDVIKLVDGLTYADLTLTQGTDADAEHTLIYQASDQQLIAVVANTVASSLGEADFITPNHTFAIAPHTTTLIPRFGLLGTGNNPSDAEIAEFDTLHFTGEGLTAENLIVSQLGDDLRLTFDGDSETAVVLLETQQKDLENLNQVAENGVLLANIMFAGQTTATDSFDMFNARSTRGTLWKRDAVTFLNELDNQVVGFADSADVINGLGGNDHIDGLSGNDLLRGGAGADTLLGAAGDDQLQGGSGSDALAGGDGFDTLLGGFGDDDLSGGADDDQLIGDFGNDTIAGDHGNDTLSGGLGDDWLSGGEGNDLLQGELGQDTLMGDAGDDTLIGGTQISVLDGGDGHDLLEAAIADDWLAGGAGNDTLMASAGDDTLLGGDDADHLLGGDGNDILEGEAGADWLNGGNGLDTLIGGDGADTLFGEGNHDSLDGGLGNDDLQGGVGNDSLAGGHGDDTLQGGDGDDRLTVTDGTNLLQGGSGQDWLIGGLGGDTLQGGDDDDVIEGDAGADWLNGGNGFDRLIGGDGADTLWGEGDNDSLDGGHGDDDLQGGSGDDVLLGGSGHDILQGGDGNDELAVTDGHNLLQGGSGHDSLIGGLGRDTLQGGDDDDRLEGGAEQDELIGGNGADQLWGDAGDDTLLGEAGDDDLDAGSGDDLLQGGSGNDSLSAGDGNDTLMGGADHDWLQGGTGNNDLQGGTGDDWLDGGEGNDTLLGGDDQDQLSGSLGDDLLNGGTGDDHLLAGEGADVLLGESGADTLAGGLGNDDLSGGSGDDELLGEAGQDTIQGGLDHDWIDGGQDHDLLMGGTGDDTLLGGEGNDTLMGGDGYDSLYGGNGNDSLIGGVDADTLVGGAGNDRITGGLGDDVFAIAPQEGVDTLLDFGIGNDVIGLSHGLTFETLNIVQGTGEQVTDTLIFASETNALLAIITDRWVGSITSDHFMVL